MQVADTSLQIPSAKVTIAVLPRHVFLHIIRLVIKDAPRDQMRLLGVRPGKLRLHDLDVQPCSHTHGIGSATVTLRLPNFKEYMIQRTIHYSSPEGRITSPTGKEFWESCSLSILRGHPDLPHGFDGEILISWSRSCDGEYMQEIDEA